MVQLSGLTNLAVAVGGFCICILVNNVRGGIAACSLAGQGGHMNMKEAAL